MARGHPTPYELRCKIVRTLDTTHKRDGNYDYKRVAGFYKLNENTVRRIAKLDKKAIMPRPLGRPPRPGNTAVRVAKKLLRLAPYKWEWPVRRLGELIGVDRTTLAAVRPEALRIVNNSGSCKVVCSATNRSLAKMVLNDVTGSTNSVWASIYAYTHQGFMQALIDRNNVGVDVRVIINLYWVRETPSGRETVATLIRARVVVFHLRHPSHHNHCNFVICDGLFGDTGTLNWTVAAEANHDEVITFVTGDEAVAELIAGFRAQLMNSVRTTLDMNASGSRVSQ